MDESREFERYYGKLLMGRELPRKVAETYKILECYKQREGKGTYLAENIGNQERCILKIAYGEQRKFLRAEYECLSSGVLSKNEALKLLDYQEKEDYAWLVREYCQGTPLDEMVAVHGILSEREVITYGLGICDAILQLHERKPSIIHRDVKPENFVVTAEGKVVLIDFDTARTYTDGKSQDTMFVGSRETAAPEQFGYSQTDVRTDVYGIGRTLLYLACGNYRMELLDRLSLSAELKRIIRKAGDFHPNHRYQDVACLKVQLLHCEQRGGKYKYVAAVLLSTAAMGAAIWIGYRLRGNTLPAGSPVVTVSASNHQPAGESGQPFATGKNDSMAEELGLDFGQTFRAEDYKEQVDQIIILYGAKDSDGIAAACEQMVTRLYEEPDLRKGEPVDVYDYDEWPEELFIDGTGRQKISYFLWFQDELLRRELGSYQSRGKRILARMDEHLHWSALEEQGSSLYRYINATEPGADNNLEEVLMDTLCIIKEGLE